MFKIIIYSLVLLVLLFAIFYNPRIDNKNGLYDVSGTEPRLMTVNGIFNFDSSSDPLFENGVPVPEGITCYYPDQMIAMKNTYLVLGTTFQIFQDGDLIEYYIVPKEYGPCTDYTDYVNIVIGQTCLGNDLSNECSYWVQYPGKYGVKFYDPKGNVLSVDSAGNIILKNDPIGSYWFYLQNFQVKSNQGIVTYPNQLIYTGIDRIPDPSMSNNVLSLNKIIPVSKDNLDTDIRSYLQNNINILDS